MKKNKDKKTSDQQAQPVFEEKFLENTDIPLKEEQSAQNIDTKSDDSSLKAQSEQLPQEKEGENTQDTSQKTDKAVFDDENAWKDKVKAFFTQYPVAKDFAAQIGREIASDKSLHTVDDCLEKALLRVLCKEYVSPAKLAQNNEFLQSYIYPNEAVRQAIVDEYLDNIQKSMPPRSISSGGQITLTPPSKPRSIEEAGAVIKTMLNNRRI